VKGLGKIAVPIGVVSIVLMLVVPLPAALIDMLLAINITASLLILLVAMQIRKPLDFAVFPSLLLVATLFRLSLNVSSTRLVLTDGYAGKVIEAFGHFVIGGSLVVGLVIFLILTIVQFVVITNGAGRVAEVGARFTLDAMPGKQMAIDADLNAGLINESQARKRAATRSPPRPTSTARWTVRPSSSRATRSPASSSRWSTSSAASRSVSCSGAWIPPRPSRRTRS
jgi:flagellar biosynthesis protein FlhA